MITAGGSLVVSLVALVGVWWTNLRADRRDRLAQDNVDAIERERHRKDRLTDEVGELLGHAQNARRLTAIYGHLVKKHESDDEPEAFQALTDITAFTATVSTVRFRIELLEPRLAEAAGDIASWCSEMGDNAIKGQFDSALTRREDEVTRKLVTAFRDLA
jgi:hypothetical protein